ncbi:MULTISPECIES: RHS repeat domain-containing protein [Burkholderia]|uniref:RHS repeat domain-containing protein n=1 Tax=Burkholderia TaxID=32008 RepID=UPI0009F532AD|nr:MULTISPECIES: RHS repeat-associated core domain-containing protein [unclassified Burkholderia]
MSTSYRGSQAFNQIFAVEEQVNKSTGSLSLTKVLIDLAGVRHSIDLKLSLVYSPGSSGILGLPKGWLYDLPYVVPGKSLSLHGRSFIIDPLWSDATGYQSGLRYENNHGILFRTVIPAQPLPSGGQYSYRADLADGTRYFFDSVGKLLAQQDRFGNSLVYSYVTDRDVYNNFLSSITDSWGQTITFAQMPGVEQSLTLPDGGNLSLALSPQGVASIVDQLNQTTTLSYSTFATQPVVTQISYPTGLTTTVTYTGITGKFSDGSSVSFPAVATLTHADASGFLDQTLYTYGMNTAGRTFTGASAGYLMSSGADGLMDSNNMSYVYDVYIQNVDANGKLVGASSLYFNFLHLAVRTEEYLVQSDGSAQSWRKIEYQYHIDPNQHARTPSFAMPVQIDSSDWSASRGAFLPTQRQTSAYDIFNQPVTRELSFYDAGTESFVKQSQERYIYQTVSWSDGHTTEMPATSQRTDAVSGKTNQTSYTLTRDKTAIAARTSAIQSRPGGAFTPWKTIQYSYDTCGRITQVTTSWASGAAEQPGVGSVTTKYAYAYDAGTHQGSIAVTDSRGNTKTEYVWQDLPKAPVCRTVDALGNVTSMTLDAFGRTLTLTQADGSVSRTIYRIWAQDRVNQMVSANPLGYVLATQYDGLSRQIQLLDNGGLSTHPNGQPQRVVNRWQYDAMGRVIAVTDVDGRVITQRWDSLGRKIGSTDPVGNVYTYSYSADDSSMTTQLNGAKVLWTQSDPQNHVLAKQVFPVSGGLDTFGMANVYDGFGNVINETWTSITSAGGVPQTLKSKTYAYNPDSALTSATLASTAANGVTSTKSITRDLMNNPLSWVKTTTYGGQKRFQHQSPVNAYDADSHLISVTNAVGQVQTYQYDAAGRMSGATTPGGSTLAYAYDRVGNLLTMTVTQGGTRLGVQYTYDAVGRMTSVGDGMQQLSMTYTLDGKTQQVTYPGLLTQSYAFDASSRVIRSTDVSGTQTSYQYRPDGLVGSVSQGALSLVIDYGVAAGRKGTPIGQTMSTTGPQAGLVWKRSFSYDGFGRLASQSTESTSSAYQASYIYDVQSRLISLNTNSSDGSTAAAYQYDGLDQLISESQQNGTQPPVVTTYQYDGNYNVIQSTSQGHSVNYTYNGLDQLTLPGIDYDANGNMLSDGSGGMYAYDAWNRLTSVTHPDGSSSQYRYYPTGALSEQLVQHKSCKFYQDGAQVNCTAETVNGQTQWTTFLFAQDTRIAATPLGQGTTYYETARGSTTQLFGASANAFSYAAYGERFGATDGAAFADFGWNQEFQSAASGLVYLRSRFYHPKLKRFLSYDQMQVDNRYAFGEGNPVDRIDPTGHISGAEIGLNVLGIVIGIAGAVAAPFSGGSSAVVAAGVVGGILGAASSATALAASATNNRGAEIASWVLGGIGAVADIGSVAANVMGRAASGAAAIERASASASRVMEEGAGAPWSRINPLGLDYNCVYCTLGSMTGDSAPQTARILGRTEGLVHSDAEISSMMVERGLSRTGSVHSFDDLQSAAIHVSRYSRDDEYLITINQGTMRHAVHGFWNVDGQITVFDAQQGFNWTEQALANAMPMRLWRAEGAQITRILNGEDHALNMMHLTEEFSRLHI